MPEQQPVGLLLLATRKYKQFVQSLLDDIKKYFLLSRKIEVHLFIDDTSIEYEGDERVEIIKELIPSYKFPLITLYRYKIFVNNLYPNCSYLFYMDIDMAIVKEIGEEIFGNIVAVRHPGFYQMGGGSWETRPESTSFVYPEDRINYYAGGFQGGKTEYYYRAMQQMKRDIDEDEKNGIIPIWHDESSWNCFLSKCKSFTSLHSGYVMVEEMELRKKWRIDNIPPSIIALSKNHKTIRA